MAWVLDLCTLPRRGFGVGWLLFSVGGRQDGSENENLVGRSVDVCMWKCRESGERFKKEQNQRTE